MSRWGSPSVALAGTPLIWILRIFRNGSYAQLVHGYGAMARMTGISPEASGYASFGFVWFVFNMECCLRGVLPGRTGAAAAGLFLALLASTSSTAYVALAIYCGVLVVRAMLAARRLRRSYAAWIAGTLLLATIAALLLLMLAPGLAHGIVGMFTHFTVDKQDSRSALQRGFWAKQGWDAFVVSHGLGVGAGSFRSSSLITAIMGSMGVVGLVSFALYLLKVFKPLRRSSYGPVSDERLAVGVSASWTALMIQVPLAVGSASPDPGHVFGVFCGLALALRAQAQGSAAAMRLRLATQRPAMMLAREGAR